MNPPPASPDTGRRGRTRPDWRTFLVHLDATPRATARLDLALAWAAEHGGEVVGLATIGSPDVLLAMRADVPDAIEVVALSADRLRQQAHAAVARCRARAADAGVPCSTRVVTTDDPGGALTRAAWTADVVLVGAHDDHARVEGVPDDLPQQVMLASGRPVVVVPRTGVREPQLQTVLVAWRSGREAAVAVRDALPLLARTEQVVLVEVVRGDAAAADDGDAGGLEACTWLGRHGIDARHRRIALSPAHGDEQVGAAVLADAAALGADLLVMGGYGHSRLRQWVLGGVTRHVLANATLPVLFSH